MYKWRLAAHPEYIKNIYFTFLFLLRATAHASQFLRNYEYRTGDEQQDAIVVAQVNKLLNVDLLQSCSPTFDESKMFQIPPNADPGNIPMFVILSSHT